MKTRKIVPRPSYGMMDVAAKPKQIYPKITISYKDLPEAKNWKVGEIYEVEFELKQIGAREDEYTQEATFEVHSITVDNDEDEETETE